jgi:hypothetical protein
MWAKKDRDKIFKNNFKKNMEKFLGYIVMNHCLCGSLCDIKGNDDEKMIPVFNEYMTILKDELLKDKKQKLFKYTECNKINVNYIYYNNKVNFDNDNRKSTSRTDILKNFTYEILERYGILTKRYGDYYILSSSKLFTWSNIHKMSTSDVLNFVTKKDRTTKVRTIHEVHKNMLVSMLTLFMSKTEETEETEELKILLKEYEKDILSLNQEKYNVLYKKFIEILRCIFWLYRKMSVDSIIGDSVTKVARGVDAVSVGSTKLVSDYDVTLYGNFKLMSEVIKEFNGVMSEIYGNTSEVIFDTNVYGTSFIKLSGKEIFNKEVDKYIYENEKECKGVSFSYVSGGDDDVKKNDVIDIQHIWAFIKVLKALKMIEKFDVRLYESLYKYMESHLKEGRYLRKAVSFMSTLNKRRDYVGVLGSYNTLLSKLRGMDGVLLTNMYISLVNYYGSETYFTRGAFLDVVVNQQMCGGILEKCVPDQSGGGMSWWKRKAKVSPEEPMERVKVSSEEPMERVKVSSEEPMERVKVIPMVNGEDKEGVKLNESELMDSVIENIGEMMMHVNRVKYVDRVEGAIMLSNMNNKGEYCKILSKIRDVQKNCSEDIINCGVYAMLHSCVVLLVGCFNKYIENNLKKIDEREVRFDRLTNVLQDVGRALSEADTT